MFGSDMPSPAAYSPLGCWTIVATLANAYEMYILQNLSQWVLVTLLIAMA